MQSNVLLPVCMHSCKVHSSLVPPEDAKAMPAQVSPGNVEKQKADCSPTTPDFPLHTNGPVNLHGNPLFRQRIYTTHLTFHSASGSTLSDRLIALQLCAPDYLTFIILRQIHQ